VFVFFTFSKGEGGGGGGGEGEGEGIAAAGWVVVFGVGERMLENSVLSTLLLYILFLFVGGGCSLVVVGVRLERRGGVYCRGTYRHTDIQRWFNSEEMVATQDDTRYIARRAKGWVWGVECCSCVLVMRFRVS